LHVPLLAAVLRPTGFTYPQNDQHTSLFLRQTDWRIFFSVLSFQKGKVDLKSGAVPFLAGLGMFDQANSFVLAIIFFELAASIF